MSEIPGVPEGKRLVGVKPCTCGLAGCKQYTAILEDIPKPTKLVLVSELTIDNTYGYGTCAERWAREIVKRGFGRIEEREV